jgi:prepilin-type processing-associated H-X9-DG protein
MNLPRQSISEPARRAGFTLLELCVVLATVAVLAAMLLPALASTHPNSQAFQCLNNQRQILLAWQMYAADNNDMLPPNDLFSGSTPPAPIPPIKPGFSLAWVCGAMNDPSTIGSQATNSALLTDAGHTALAKYVKSAGIFHCPADTSQALSPGVGARVRSVSMNSLVGTVYNQSLTGFPFGGPLWGGFADGGGWSQTASKYWVAFGKLGTIKNPSGIFVVLDENPLSINDAVFNVDVGKVANGTASYDTKFVDIPASYHNGACGVAFADGHSEMHKWIGTAVKNGVFTPLSAAADLQDLQWLQTRTSVPK